MYRPASCRKNIPVIQSRIVNTSLQNKLAPVAQVNILTYEHIYIPGREGNPDQIENLL